MSSVLSSVSMRNTTANGARSAAKAKRIDGRSVEAKRFKAAVARLTPKRETAVSAALVRRAAKLACKLEDMEDADTNGVAPLDVEKYAQVSGTLARILDRLNLDEPPDEPEQKPPFKIPPGWADRLSDDQWAAYQACETPEQLREWYCSLPRELLNEIYIYSGRDPLPPEPPPPSLHAPRVREPDAPAYRPPEGEELAYLQRTNARQKQAEVEAADPWNSDEMKAARRQLEKLL